jgi:hypothetical protein
MQARGYVVGARDASREGQQEGEGYEQPQDAVRLRPLRLRRTCAAFRSTSFFGTWISAFITLSKRGKGESELERLSSFGMAQAYSFLARA